MTRRSNKQVERSFMFPDKAVGFAWVVTDYCDPECACEGASVVAMFDNEQIARQFADARGLSSPRKMSIYHAMKAI